MVGEFFQAGGMGMYPTLLIGFVAVMTSVLAVRKAEFQKTAVAFLVTTLVLGALGTAMGLIQTSRWVTEHAKPEERYIGVLGVAESLNNSVLALVLVLFGLLALSASLYRHRGAR